MRTLKSSAGFLVVAMMLALVVSPASAAIIDGDLTFGGGTATVDDTTMTFGNPAGQTVLTGTGSFAGLVGDSVILANLDSVTEPVNTPNLNFANFIQFAISSIAFELDFLVQGTFPGSPFDFDDDALGATVTVRFSGTVNDGLGGPDSAFIGSLTTQFPGETTAQVLDRIANDGSVTQSFSGSIRATSVPEPSTGLMLLGAGLLGLAAVRRRRA